MPSKPRKRHIPAPASRPEIADSPRSPKSKGDRGVGRAETIGATAMVGLMALLALRAMTTDVPSPGVDTSADGGTAPTEVPIVHEVRPGENMTEISYDFSTTRDEQQAMLGRLLAQTGGNPDLEVGQNLVVGYIDESLSQQSGEEQTRP